MSLKDHKKHTALVRPDLGDFGRNEWAIDGAPCADIKKLVAQITGALKSIAKVGYADAHHHDEKVNTAIGAALEYIVGGQSQQLVMDGQLNAFQNRQLSNDCDLILINGNHHQAKKQVVIIDDRKKESIRKKVDKLTDVRLFLLTEGETELFDFIKVSVPEWHNIPVYRLDETEKIVTFFLNELERSKPILNGLVLAGGKSRRMGTAKSQINWHGKPQQYYQADILRNYCDDVFISQSEPARLEPAYQPLYDTFSGLGPFGAILSAFREQPDRAWLVIACDLPLLDAATLTYLVENRNRSAVATAYQNKQAGFPEPLITIWEPKSYQILLSFLAQGYSCPRKLLINSDVKILQAPNPLALTNVNTPEDMAKVRLMLQKPVEA